MQAGVVYLTSPCTFVSSLVFRNSLFIHARRWDTPRVFAFAVFSLANRVFRQKKVGNTAYHQLAPPFPANKDRIDPRHQTLDQQSNLLFSFRPHWFSQTSIQRSFSLLVWSPVTAKNPHVATSSQAFTGISGLFPILDIPQVVLRRIPYFLIIEPPASHPRPHPHPCPSLSPLRNKADQGDKYQTNKCQLPQQT